MNTCIKNNLKKLKLKIKASVHFLYEKFIKPKSKNEDHKRREFILNILLLCSILLYVFGFLISAYCTLIKNQNNEPNNIIVLLILLLFVTVYLISRFKSYIHAAHLFITIFLAPIFYAAYKCGVDLPAVLLFSVLLIIMSSILINTRFSFFITLTISVVFIYLTNLQFQNVIMTDRTWKNEKMIEPENTIVYAIILLIIATISWLSNREIEKSLERARLSEAALKKERDFLEIRVDERTKELQKIQLEKITEMSRLAEFGRLSSGLFHDLVNPLTALSFNLEKIKQTKNYHFKEIEDELNRAFSVTQKMREFINSIKKQFNHEENKELFSLNHEISDVLQVLIYRTRKNNININFEPREEIKLFGDAIKFNQVVLNIISNAIEAYPLNNFIKIIDVNLFNNENYIVLHVKDYGQGVPKDIENEIFKAFFTTKKNGTGVGLSLVKNIVEKDFNGEINFKNNENQGATFIIKFKKCDQSTS